jgi:hypothetical protein
VAENVDPVEKKPFFHFLLAARSYQISPYPHMNSGDIDARRSE